MPGKNLEKVYASDTYYHLYNRGVDKRNIFKDDDDYRVFLNLLKRYLSPESVKDRQGRIYPNFRQDIDLLAFCLMPNHYHLLIYVNDNAESMTGLIRSLTTAYSMYFNRRNKRSGHLFQDRFRAVTIQDDAYLWHISRYIHLNPLDIKMDYNKYPYSSLGHYVGNKSADWLNADIILDMFRENKIDYSEFLDEYKDIHTKRKLIEQELF